MIDDSQNILEAKMQNILKNRCLAALVMAAHDSSGIGKTLPPVYFTSKGFGAESLILEEKRFITQDKKKNYFLTSIGKEIISDLGEYFKIILEEYS